MINRVVLVGRLTKDPELRKTPSGASVTSFTVAVQRRVSGDAANSNLPTADYVPCVAWNKTAELLCQYMHKGSQVGVEGRIQTRNYDDPNSPGKKVYVTEVVCDSLTFLESKSASENRTSQSDNNSYYSDGGYEEMAPAPGINISSDDLPF